MAMPSMLDIRTMKSRRPRNEFSNGVVLIGATPAIGARDIVVQRATASKGVDFRGHHEEQWTCWCDRRIVVRK
jgi:hypothetical protein